MLSQNNHNSTVVSDLVGLSPEHHFNNESSFNSENPVDKKARERLAAQRKMTARRAIEQHYEKRELELAAKEYWFDG